MTPADVAATTSEDPRFDIRPVLAELLGRLPATVQAFVLRHVWFVGVRGADTTGAFVVDLALEAARVAQLQTRGLVSAPEPAAEQDRLFLIYLTPLDPDERGARVVAHEIAHAWLLHHRRDVPVVELEQDADELAEFWLDEWRAR